MTRVLIVEDEPTLREVERDILHDGGYEAIEAADGSAALAQLRQSGEPLVVILDNRLPDMEGGELLHEATRDPALSRHAYIFASGKAPAEYPRELRHALRVLGVEVVPKPFDVDRLLDAIARAQARLASPPKATKKHHDRNAGGRRPPTSRSAE